MQVNLFSESEVDNNAKTRPSWFGGHYFTMEVKSVLAKLEYLADA